jgi:uridine kinase
MVALNRLVRLASAKRASAHPGRSVLLGLSGIDGAGKGFIGARLQGRLTDAGFRVALINVDGWLNLPATRFSSNQPGEHFYHHALRLGELFRDLVLPLCATRSHRFIAQHVEETATDYRPRVYEFNDIDMVLLEGIFIFKRAFRPQFDLGCWVDCTFETALERALTRAQEGLPPEETTAAYHTIYFPAQRLHLERDEPRRTADEIIPNDHRLEPSGAPALSLRSG